MHSVLYVDLWSRGTCKLRAKQNIKIKIKKIKRKRNRESLARVAQEKTNFKFVCVCDGLSWPMLGDLAKSCLCLNGSRARRFKRFSGIALSWSAGRHHGKM